MAHQQPYDEKGRKVSRLCPNLDCDGTLQPEIDPLTNKTRWCCDGLVDPNDTNKELEACMFSHVDGEPYNASAETYAAWMAQKGFAQPAPVVASPA